MRVVAGVAAVAFAVLHGVPGIATLAGPVAARGSHEASAVPRWARVLWLAIAAAMLTGAILYLLSGSVTTAVVVCACAVALCLLAIANGFWVHGRPTVSHHLIRGALAAIVVTLVLIGTE